jgi:hypothetical protein
LPDSAYVVYCSAAPSETYLRHVANHLDNSYPPRSGHYGCSPKA